jgi:hypothetical protein
MSQSVLVPRFEPAASRIQRSTNHWRAAFGSNQWRLEVVVVVVVTVAVVVV